MEGESSQEGNERPSISGSVPGTIVDFEDAVVDTDEEAYGEVIDHPANGTEDGWTSETSVLRVFFILFISEHVPDSAIVSTAQ